MVCYHDDEHYRERYYGKNVILLYGSVCNFFNSDRKFTILRIAMTSKNDGLTLAVKKLNGYKLLL